MISQRKPDVPSPKPERFVDGTSGRGAVQLPSLTPVRSKGVSKGAALQIIGGRRLPNGLRPGRVPAPLRLQQSPKPAANDRTGLATARPFPAKTVPQQHPASTRVLQSRPLPGHSAHGQLLSFPGARLAQASPDVRQRPRETGDPSAGRTGRMSAGSSLSARIGCGVVDRNRPVPPPTSRRAVPPDTRGGQLVTKVPGTRLSKGSYQSSAIFLVTSSGCGSPRAPKPFPEV